MPNINERLVGEWQKFGSVVRRNGKLTQEECGKAMLVDDNLLVVYGAVAFAGIVSGTMPLLLVGCVGLGMASAEKEKNEMQAFGMPDEVNEERMWLKDHADNPYVEKNKRS